MVDLQKIDETASFLRLKGIDAVDYAIVLGTGLSKLLDLLDDVTELNYHHIPNFPISTVQSHKGKLIFGQLNNKSILILAGRFHFYEGYNMEEVTYYVHVLKALKTKQLIITNAAGGLNPHYNAGDIVVINDHINLFPLNPLRGVNDDRYGNRFPDMLNAYPVHLIDDFKTAAKSSDIKIQEGVYLGWQGPSLETPAEYKMARNLGADLLGMSSVPEVIVAKYCEMPVLMISIVSNMCYPISAIKEMTVEKIIHKVEESAGKLATILKNMLT